MSDVRYQMSIEIEQLFYNQRIQLSQWTRNWKNINKDKIESNTRAVTRLVSSTEEKCIEHIEYNLRSKK